MIDVMLNIFFAKHSRHHATKLLTQFNALPDGVKFLVDLRAELLRFSREDRALKALERDFKAILVSWFDVDFLELEANFLGYDSCDNLGKTDRV